jgi:site-specific DNA recombinase
MPSRPASKRCAIYTRKSSDEGLEQAFNSLDAQREACEAYVQSQKHEGWSIVKTAYNDGGFSGGTMSRPALQALLSAVEAGKVDVIVVDKVDRLTRSLADFAKIVEVLDAKGVSFVSVTQQFNTTTSMGRLTLNVLLSFAQFEREVTGERIRDKIAASKKKGMWMGGSPPLGYDARDRQLVVNEVEAERVRLIFRRYLELGSVAALMKDLRASKVHSKRWTTRTGRVLGGKPFMRGALYDLLQNRIYRGEITHKDTSYPGNHDPIVPLELWESVQARLAENRRKDLGRRESVSETSPLTGLLYDDRGHPMSPTYTQKASGKRYRYYLSAAVLDEGRGEPGTVPRLPAHALAMPAASAIALASSWHSMARPSWSTSLSVTSA